MRLLTWLGVTAAALLCLKVGNDALRYLLPGFSGPDFIMQNAFARPWLTIHAALGAVALVLGFTQFVPALRRRAPKVHRWAGRIYLTACIVSGTAGLLLALKPAAGPIAAVGFGLAAVVSLVSAVQAWRYAVARRFDEHRRWVFRSYAVIFAAVTLRIWIPLSNLTELDFMESYRLIAYLAWMPNLIAVEIYLALSKHRLRAPARPVPGLAPGE